MNKVSELGDAPHLLMDMQSMQEALCFLPRLHKKLVYWIMPAF